MAARSRRPGTFRKAARSPLGIASGILLALILLLAILSLARRSPPATDPDPP